MGERGKGGEREGGKQAAEKGGLEDICLGG
jgi:hypothetical protein